MENSVNDLRSAIALLQRHEGQYIETDHPSILMQSWQVCIVILARAVR